MKEKIKIKGFLGIENIKIDINKITIIIGPQASGKSVTAKLIHFFKTIPDEILEIIQNGENLRSFNSQLLNKFKDYFPQETWQSTAFEIVYTIDNLNFKITKSQKIKNPKIIIDEKIKKLFNQCKITYKRYHDKYDENKDDSFDYFVEYNPTYKIRDYFHDHLKQFDCFGYQQIYVPAGRSFFANLQSSIFTFLSTNNAIDPLLKDFGMFYENIKQFGTRHLRLRDDDYKEYFSKVSKLVQKIIKGKHVIENNEDYIVLDNGKLIKVANSSSGQQEALPLALILQSLNGIRFSRTGSTCFIEEPEAHLFPLAQKEIIDLIALTFNNNVTSNQFFITTHSPYILTTLNNNIYAGKLLSEGIKINSIYDENIAIDPKLISAYSIQDGKSKSMICPETELISSEIIDSVSNDLSVDFGKLLEL